MLRFTRKWPAVKAGHFFVWRARGLAHLPVIARSNLSVRLLPPRDVGKQFRG
jgi:hypothetical protein